MSYSRDLDDATLGGAAQGASPTARGTATLGIAALLGGLWWVLSDGVLAAWSIGLPVVAGTTWWCLRQRRSTARLPRPSGLATFLVYFLTQSLRGGLDVARLAVSPAASLRPGFTTYAIRLPPGPARRLFVNTVSLLPGTLSADIDADRLLVHRIGTGPAENADLRDCETRIAALFGLNGARPPGGHRE